MLENLVGKKIAIVGLGINNQKLSEFFTKHGIKHEVIDNWSTNSDLVGKLDLFDIIFRTPGLPYLSPAVQQAKEKGVEISSQTKLFFDLCPAQIIGVTGTKGKGTTSTLIANMLEAVGEKVWLAGNIGRDPFEFIEFIHPQDYVVLELSSFQLQDLHKSPHIAVVLNITADHLEQSGQYTRPAHASLQEYLEAKLQIVAHQTSKDFAVLSHLLPPSVRELGMGQKIIFTPDDVADFEYQLIGKHNLENIAAANAVGKLLKVSDSKIRQTVKEFKGLPHRLQRVGQFKGIAYIDDSVSTNEDSTIAAIEAFPSPLILILGGASKGLDYEKLGQAVKTHPHLKGIVVVGEEADKILEVTRGFAGTVLTGALNMHQIVAQAQSIAAAGDTILLSPAAASFGMFKDYKDRAEQFIKEIRKD